MAAAAAVTATQALADPGTDASGTGALASAPDGVVSDRADAAKNARSGWLGLPVVSYAPETSLVLGAFVMRYFRIDDGSHDTTFTLLATASFREQFIIEFLPDVYFDRNDHRIGAHLIAQHFPDRFFGVGNSASDATVESYDRRSFELVGNFRRRIAGEFYAGLTTDQLVIDIDVRETDGLLATREYAGEQGGVSSGVGLAASFDERDERAYPTRGAFVELLVMPFLPAFGSDYRFSRTKLDARYFVPTWPGQVLAMRYVLDFAFGEVPFYQLPQFGGPNSMRGYYRGKFRDKTVQTLEAEYRLHLFWLFGAAAFAGAGQVGEHFGAMASAPLRPAVGGGLRFDLSGGDHYNLRLDAAGWSSEFGLYVSLLEAF